MPTDVSVARTPAPPARLPGGPRRTGCTRHACLQRAGAQGHAAVESRPKARGHRERGVIRDVVREEVERVEAVGGSPRRRGVGTCRSARGARVERDSFALPVLPRTPPRSREPERRDRSASSEPASPGRTMSASESRSKRRDAKPYPPSVGRLHRDRQLGRDAAAVVGRFAGCAGLDERISPRSARRRRPRAFRARTGHGAP